MSGTELPCMWELALSRILCEDLNCLLLFLLKFLSFKREERIKKKQQLLRNKPQNNTKQTPACSHSFPTLPLCMTSPSNVNLTSHLVPQYRNNSVLLGDQQSLHGAEMAGVWCMASPLDGRTPEKTCRRSLNEIWDTLLLQNFEEFSNNSSSIINLLSCIYSEIACPECLHRPISLVNQYYHVLAAGTQRFPKKWNPWTVLAKSSSVTKSGDFGNFS